MKSKKRYREYQEGPRRTEGNVSASVWLEEEKYPVELEYWAQVVVNCSTVWVEDAVEERVKELNKLRERRDGGAAACLPIHFSW